ncbi:hypothetical protein RD792_001583 [Penstemon davidsonii]|uniref:Endonuclease/exonuclease/phosphatase domain-containing protein n=1 Tax=Penstemon davidsonii TaxID=160366 RepID=A0ABR0DQ06_9LAMI|nr:hypothetical protein RD792_001583 [Penstemon davidsonii]
MSTTPGPLCRKFVPIEQSEVTSISKPTGFKFSVVSYNMLAQAYVKRSVFPHSPAPCLKVLFPNHVNFFCFEIPISAEMIIQETIDYNDLVNSVEDGEDLTVDKDESKAGSQLKEDHEDPNDPRVRLKRDCVGMMSAFRLKDTSSHHVIIANTHLYWDPEWADVKIAQAKYLLSRLAGFKELVTNKFDCTPSIIVTGDFNSVPGDQVYQYLVSGTSLAGPESADDLPMPLSSVYAFTRGEPEFTNCTPGFTGTLDYILFSPCGDLTPVSYLDLPGSESSDVIGGLPNYYHPSDHLPIGAEFEVDHV